MPKPLKCGSRRTERERYRARRWCWQRLGLALAAAVGCVGDGWRPRASRIDAAVEDGSEVGCEAGQGCGAPSCVGTALRALSASPVAHTCAIRCDGGVWCWGSNERGQLGDGTLTTQRSPVQVLGLGGPATSLSTGYNHSCAVVGQGVRCWGENTYGGLGDGTRTDRPTPVTAVGLGGVPVLVAAGGLHTCALVEGGDLWCWGRNEHGGIGDGTLLDRLQPARIELEGPMVSVVAGQYHTCVRSEAGRVWCWGSNVFGAVGDGGTQDRVSPRPVTLPAPALMLSTRSNTTCALLEGGQVWCWGFNAEGGVGDRGRTNRHRPVRVLDLEATADVAAGERHSCAVSGGGTARCWGSNARGQLGDGTQQNQPSPTEVLDPGGLAAVVVAGGAHSCVALRDGGARCWGADDRGQLGDGGNEDQRAPVEVRLPP
ncbi:MAG: chromosome condensation regulator RCC1 [Deltaproteobacteria bacterium]|nr:chromosome condensation regulator RCC1 [Deltaproteobacteria bacterium]